MSDGECFCRNYRLFWSKWSLEYLLYPPAATWILFSCFNLVYITFPHIFADLFSSPTLLKVIILKGNRLYNVGDKTVYMFIPNFVLPTGAKSKNKKIKALCLQSKDTVFQSFYKYSCFLRHLSSNSFSIHEKKKFHEIQGRNTRLAKKKKKLLQYSLFKFL